MRNVAWVLLVCLVGVFAGSGVARGQSPTGSCGGDFQQGHSLVTGRDRSVSPDGTTPHSITLQFGDSRKTQTVPLGLDLSTATKGDTLAGVPVGAYLAEGKLTNTDGRVIYATSKPVVLFSSRHPRKQPEHADVCVKLDPLVSSGTYRGEVLASIQDGNSFSFPLTITLRDSRWLAILYVGLGVFLGLTWKVCSDLRNRSKPNGVRASLWDYVRDWNFPTILILAVVSGWLGYVEIYEANQAWGASGFDALKLFGTCFGFQLGSVGGLELGQRLTQGVMTQPMTRAAA